MLLKYRGIIYRLESHSVAYQCNVLSAIPFRERFAIDHEPLLVNAIAQDWGAAPDVSHFYGRTTELTTLTQWILHDQCWLLGLLGMGGIGKTALAAKLTDQVQNQFAYVIWRSLRNVPPIETLIR